MHLLLPLALATEPLDPEARYAAEHLERHARGVSEPVLREDAPPSGSTELEFAATSQRWAIEDGLGQDRDVPEVMAAAGYAEEAEALRRRGRRMRAASVGLGLAGIAVWTGGVVLLQDEGAERQSLMASGASLAGVGLLVGAVFPSFHRRAMLQPGLAWSAAEADAYVAAANERLALELGLQVEDAEEHDR